MYRHRSPWILTATLTFVFMSIVGLNFIISDNVAANPSIASINQETTPDDLDPPAEDIGRDDGFDSEDSSIEEEEYNEGDMETFEEDELGELELHQMEIETNIARLEMITRLAEIAKDDVAMASYAIMHMEESMESEEAGILMLKKLIASDEVSHPVKNLLKMKLAELYSWSNQEDAAIDMFKSMMSK